MGKEIENTILLSLDGTYDEEVHKKLSGIIHNIASNKVVTNPTVSVEDLEQDAWYRIIQVIKSKLKDGIELPISYLVTIAKNCALATCMKNDKYLECIDVTKNTYFNASEVSHGQISIHTEKNKLEYELSRNQPDMDDAALDQVIFEEAIFCIDEPLVKNFILMKYVHEFGGTSPRLESEYNKFFDNLPDDKKELLEKSKKISNNIIFKCLGMRATDNISTEIRNGVKKALYQAHMKINHFDEFDNYSVDIDIEALSSSLSNLSSFVTI